MAMQGRPDKSKQVLTDDEMLVISNLAERLKAETEGMEASRSLNDSEYHMRVFLMKSLATAMVCSEKGFESTAMELVKPLSSKFKALGVAISTYGRGRT